MVFTQTLGHRRRRGRDPGKGRSQAVVPRLRCEVRRLQGYASFAGRCVAIVVNAIVKSGSTDRLRIRDSNRTTQMDG